MHQKRLFKYFIVILTLLILFELGMWILENKIEYTFAKVGKIVDISGNVKWTDNLYLKKQDLVLSNIEFDISDTAYLAIELPVNDNSITVGKNIIEFNENSKGLFIKDKYRTRLYLKNGEAWIYFNNNITQSFFIQTEQTVIEISDRTICFVDKNTSGTCIGVLQGSVEFEWNNKKHIIQSDVWTEELNKIETRWAVNPGDVFTTYNDDNDNIRNHIEWSHYKDKLNTLLPTKEN